MGLHSAPMPDDETIQAAMYGPLVLAGRFDPVSKDLSFVGYGPKRGEQSTVPDILADSSHPLSWVEPDPKHPLAFHTVGQPQSISMIPLNQVIHERYAVYWKVRTS